VAAVADRYRCKKCLKNITASGKPPELRYRKHDATDGTECENSRTIIPAWIIKRGPETDDSDAPVIGRDYAPCPECRRSPLLDDDGKFMQHVTDPTAPGAERVQCPMVGKPYVAPEGEECQTNTAAPESAADSCAVPTSAPRDDAPPPSRPESSPTEAEEMISKWAETARQIENRELPQTEPSPESTPTQPDLPSRPDAPEAPPSSPSPSAASRTGADSADGAGAEASSPKPPPAAPSAATTDTAPDSAEASPPDIEALAKIFPRSARTPDGISTDSAAPAPADVLATATQAVQAVMPGATVEYDATPIPVLSGALTPTPDAAPSTAATPTTPADAPPSSEFAQPGLPFSQPAKLPAAVTSPIPMDALGEQVVARMKELFYSYDNRKTADNRSAQATLGPSEIGTPCDRRLAMSLLHVEPVNPGGDGWAAFVGTAVHSALADMFMWASGDTGRFAVETPLTFPNKHVPKGTSDLLDRMVFMVDDHKIMGRWSLDKLRTKGIPPGYRVQLHTYGYGQRLKGEKIEYVCLIAWPREASSLADMYAVVERYDPEVAREALARVDRIADEVKAYETERTTWAGLDINAQKMSIAKEFPVADDCRFCKWYAPGDPDMTRGCPGR
jgi:hypothetical protein